MSNWSKDESLQYLKDKVAIIKTAMLNTYNDDSGLHSRPMGTADIDQQGNIWFFTDEYSPKARQITEYQSVLLTYADTSSQTYICIIGEATLVDDKEKMKALWNPFVKAFFPQGLDDPRITLLKVTPTEAEYWDSTTNKMVALYNLLKAVISGKPYDEGKHGKIAL